MPWKRSPLSVVDIRLIEQLYAAGLPTLVAGQVVAVVCFLAFGGIGGGAGVTGWILVFSFLSVIRLWRIGYWRNQLPWDGAKARAAACEYQVLSLFAGIIWSYPLLALSADMDSVQKIFTLVITIGMPVSAMPANSIYLPVYRLFMLPMIGALLYWSIALSNALNAHFFFIAIVHGTILYITAKAYYTSQRKALEGHFENQRLIDDLSDAKSRLEAIAYLDPLTGLANRRWFQMEADNILARNQETHQQAALMLIDMDNFKQVNDQLGHDAGDRLLVTIADRLNKALRLTDVAMHKSAEVSRYGGDEFMALLIDTEGQDGARKAVTRIKRMIAEPISLNGVEMIPGVSIGVAMAPDDGEDLNTLIRKADMAMYRAKQSGRNQFCFYSEIALDTSQDRQQEHPG